MVMASSHLQRLLLLKRAPPPFAIPPFPLPLLTAFNTPSIEISHFPLPPQKTSEIKVEALPIFPAFPQLGPIWDPSGIWTRVETEAEAEAEAVVRADSVKKKRKRKMNKHKLRKLRKQLRLRT